MDRPDFEEIAEAIAIELDTNADLSYTGVIRLNAATKYIANALKQLHDDTLERAAKVADRMRTSVIGNDEYELGRNEALSEFSIEARSLKSTTENGGAS